MHLNKLIVRIMHIIRMSVGDFNFDATDYLPDYQKQLYWGLYFISTFMTCIVFMNFIIAEVSNSYAIVKQDIDALIYKERSTLITEAEDILSENTKKNDLVKFPKYIVLREMEKWNYALDIIFKHFKFNYT